MQVRPLNGTPRARAVVEKAQAQVKSVVKEKTAQKRVTKLQQEQQELNRDMMLVRMKSTLFLSFTMIALLAVMNNACVASSVATSARLQPRSSSFSAQLRGRRGGQASV